MSSKDALEESNESSKGAPDDAFCGSSYNLNVFDRLFSNRHYFPTVPVETLSDMKKKKRKTYFRLSD